MEHTVGQDAGAQIRDGMKSVNHIGACPETDWPYVITKFAQKPPTRAFKDARLGKALSYQRVVQTLDQMKGCLASGLPIVSTGHCGEPRSCRTTGSGQTVAPSSL